MYRILPESSGSFVALQVSGKLEQVDYAGFLPDLQAAISAHGRINLLWDMHQFSGWTPGGLWADGSFDVKHATDFNRIAVVGEKKWHEWMTTVMKPFTSAEVRYFDESERETASAWCRGELQEPGVDWRS